MVMYKYGDTGLVYLRGFETMCYTLKLDIILKVVLPKFQTTYEESIA